MYLLNYLIILHLLSISFAKKLIACKLMTFKNEQGENKYTLSPKIYIEENNVSAKGAEEQIGKELEIEINKLKSMIKSWLLKL